MTDTPPPPIRPFADWLRDQAGGTSHEELSEGLRDLVAKVMDTGKKGTLTYVVTVEPMPKVNGNALACPTRSNSNSPSSTARPACSSPTTTATSSAPTRDSSPSRACAKSHHPEA